MKVDGYNYTEGEQKEMREWLRNHYHFGRLEISDYMVLAFLKLKQQNHEESTRMGTQATSN